MYNSKTGNIPHVIHGNGPIKVRHNSLIWEKDYIN